MKINLSESSAPSFIILKKDGQFRFIYNFRRLNKQIKPTPYPLPHFKDMLKKLSNFTYVTKFYVCYDIIFDNGLLKYFTH